MRFDNNNNYSRNFNMITNNVMYTRVVSVCSRTTTYVMTGLVGFKFSKENHPSLFDSQNYVET